VATHTWFPLNTFSGVARVVCHALPAQHFQLIQLCTRPAPNFATLPASLSQDVQQHCCVTLACRGYYSSCTSAAPTTSSCYRQHFFFQKAESQSHGHLLRCLPPLCLGSRQPRHLSPSQCCTKSCKAQEGKVTMASQAMAL
jgi:hypothetical protein